MTESDESLVIASCSGSRSAFEQLVRRTSRLLYARLYLQTGDPHRAEDLVQETYLQAWRSIGNLQDPAKFRPWLLAIGNSVFLDSLRKLSAGKRALSPSGVQSLQAIADPAVAPSEQAQQSEQRQRVLETLKQLPEEYQQVLMLRYLAGADYDTIARQLALSNGSLRGLLHRGLNLLREKMKGSESSL